MATPLVVYRQELGERFSPARLGAEAALEPGERAKLRDAVLEHYDGFSLDRPLEPGELRPCIDAPAPLSLKAPPETALASVLDPMALRRELMARPLKRAILAGTRVVLADPVARLLSAPEQPGQGPQLIAALGMLAQLTPLIEEGVLLLASPTLAEEKGPAARLGAAAHWVADAARLRDRPGWRAIRAARDTAFDRFAIAGMVGRQLAALERAAAAGAPGHLCLTDAEAEAGEASALGDLFWALAHYDLGEIDRTLMAPLEPDDLGERRRDGAADPVEPVCGVPDAPFGHVGRITSAVWPAAGAIALDEVVAIRLGEEAYEEWRLLLAEWLKEAAAGSDEMRDPRAAPDAEMRDRFAEWERRTGERLGRLQLGRAIETARESGQQLAVGAALASRPGPVARALNAVSGEASRMDSVLEKLVLQAPKEGEAEPALGAYLAETRRRAE